MGLSSMQTTPPSLPSSLLQTSVCEKVYRDPPQVMAGVAVWHRLKRSHPQQRQQHQRKRKRTEINGGTEHRCLPVRPIWNKSCVCHSNNLGWSQQKEAATRNHYWASVSSNCWGIQRLSSECQIVPPSSLIVTALRRQFFF